MSEALTQTVTKLEQINDHCIDMARELVQAYPATYYFDLYNMSCLNRTLNLNRGFISQIRDNNFIAASPLVRINIDTLLRLFAPNLIDYNIDDFAKDILSGTALDSLKDNQNQKMKDTHLANELTKQKGFEWVKVVYSWGNSSVHHSEKHILAANKIEPEKIIDIVRKTDEFIADEQKVLATEYMIKITEAILHFVSHWVIQKKVL
jgi:hypothetical protein